MFSKSLILLNEKDNVVICRNRIAAGTALLIDGENVVVRVTVELGHKLARRALDAGEKAIKFGVPIGSMIAPVAQGGHVHLHNMKSDYVPTHTRQTEGRTS